MNVKPLTSKQLVGRAIAGDTIPRPAVGPLAVHYCAALTGATIRRYTTDARTLAESVIRYYETFQPDAVWLSADTWVTAQAMGASVDFPGENQPMAGTGEPLVSKASDVDRIPPPDPSSQGRWPLMLEAMARIDEAIGGEAFIVACLDQYPFSLACALMGMDHLMLGLIDDRPLVDALLERCVEYAVAYGAALAAAGADMLSGGDSPAGLIGPVRYREVALPFERQVLRKLKDVADRPVSLHICGDATPILADMAKSGADVLELDHQVDVQHACRVVGPDIAIWGNMDPVGLLSLGGPREVERAAGNLIESFGCAGHRRFVLSSGCTLAMETPAVNLRAMIAAAH
ncbi:MAG: uroporphyrinogen decarboxylase family protein [Planctomycetes bacterium]|nr:uroporphyrinogen decarboxylase family protein [Planctomycetota bacterium]